MIGVDEPKAEKAASERLEAVGPNKDPNNNDTVLWIAGLLSAINCLADVHRLEPSDFIFYRKSSIKMSATAETLSILYLDEA